MTETTSSFGDLTPDELAELASQTVDDVLAPAPPSVAIVYALLAIYCRLDDIAAYIDELVRARP